MSGVISQYDYDEARSELTLWFGSDLKCYKYSLVPRPVYDGLVRAESMGRYFNTVIKDHYPCRLASPSEQRNRRWQSIRSAS
ncbi:KTSC domain-containing protein [Devosia sediminis]|uniref:KTSC domain-containing protein n=1 Tax=Devosia sediminis TaxID=2798801 RepID=A0A934IU31_9HYPH|nr:KTSC domain-containing protein [Devosia sediminis]MBJ3785166.1 KTSC domain-containing protein [Devosia sediminis]